MVDAAIGAARDDSDRDARRLGMSRRQFLPSLCGAATTLLAPSPGRRRAFSPSSVTSRGTSSEAIRRTIPTSHRTYGPSTTTELRRHVARERANVPV